MTFVEDFGQSGIERSLNTGYSGRRIAAAEPERYAMCLNNT